MTSKIPLNTPFLEGNEKKYLNDVIDSGWLSRGPYNKALEEKFSSFCGVSHGLTVTSGTVAVQVLLMAAGLQGKRVAVPAYTCMSVAQAVVHSGAIPVFVDVEKDTFGISMDSLKMAHKKFGVDAVLLNHLYGYIAKDTGEIKDWCHKNNVILLEDASEAHGADSKWGRAGSIGEGAALSLRSEKMIGVGEGGIVVMKTKEMWDKAYYWINDARPSDKIRYWTTGAGYNYFMPNALGAIGLAQVEQIEEIIKRKRKIGKRYVSEFSKRGLEHMICPEGDSPVYWINVALMGNDLNRDDMITMMENSGIEMRPGFYPLNLLPAYRHYETVETPNSHEIGRRLIAFPSNVYLTDEQIDFIFERFDFYLGK